MLVTPCRNREASKSRDLRQSKRFEQEDKELKLEVEKSDCPPQAEAETQVMSVVAPILQEDGETQQPEVPHQL